MKFKVTFKDPDSLHDAIDEGLDSDLTKLGLSEDEAEAVKDVRKEHVLNACRKWFEYYEYVTLEVDTDAQTCTVVPNY